MIFTPPSRGAVVSQFKLVRSRACRTIGLQVQKRTQFDVFQLSNLLSIVIMLGALASIRKPRSPIIFFASSILMALAYAIAEYILDGDINSLIYLGMLVVGSIGVITILQMTHEGVYLFLAWMS